MAIAESARPPEKMKQRKKGERVFFRGEWWTVKDVNAYYDGSPCYVLHADRQPPDYSRNLSGIVECWIPPEETWPNDPEPPGGAKPTHG